MNRYYSKHFEEAIAKTMDDKGDDYFDKEFEDFAQELKQQNRSDKISI